MILGSIIVRHERHILPGLNLHRLLHDCLGHADQVAPFIAHSPWLGCIPIGWTRAANDIACVCVNKAHALTPDVLMAQAAQNPEALGLGAASI